MSDPVADKSGFLCMYMSSHPDTLVSYAKHFGHISESLLSAKMESIDSKGMNLSYVTKKDGPNYKGEKKVVRVIFDPPLSGYEEVKPRLLGMKADADEVLGTAKVPHITSFVLPTKSIQTALLLSFLAYTTWAPSTSASNAPYWIPANFIRSYVGPTALKWIWGFTLVAHGLEGAFAFTLARKHQMPLGVAVSYISAVTLFGFPVLLDLRSRIQTARIDSIMKGN